MDGKEKAHDLVMCLFKVRMSFRQLVVSRIRKEGMDMTFEMMQVMHRLHKQSGVSQRLLAEKTFKDKACLTNLLSNLEKKGWVRRETDPVDRRNRLVYLTDEGKRVSARLAEALDRMYGAISDEVGREELRDCESRLSRFDDILNKIR